MTWVAASGLSCGHPAHSDSAAERRIHSPTREPSRKFIARILVASKNEVVDELLVTQAQAIGTGLLRQLVAGEFPALLMGLGVAQGALLAAARKRPHTIDIPADFENHDAYLRAFEDNLANYLNDRQHSH